MSSIARAEKAALSLSNNKQAPTPSPGVAAAAVPPMANIYVVGPPLSVAGVTNSTDASINRGEIKRVTVAGGKEGYPRRLLLVAAPAYPLGLGGRLSASRPPPGGGRGGGAPAANRRDHYRMIFDSFSRPGGSQDAAATAAAGGGGEGGGGELPVGLEAVRDEKDGVSHLYIREIIGNSGSSAGVSRHTEGGAGRGMIARIETTPAAAKKDGRETAAAAYSVVLLDADGSGSGAGELMAVRVATTTHPTTEGGLAAAPREVRAVILLTRPLSPTTTGEDAGRRGGTERGNESDHGSGG